MRPLAPRLLAASCWLVLLVGCEQGLMVGPVCDLNSDCVEPLVCVEGRCNIECVSQRDCIRGAHCAVVEGVGRCLIDVPLDTTSSPCGPGRACFDESVSCRDYTCWNECETSADCAADSLCRQGICVNPDSPGGAYGAHVACDASHPCDAGEVCASHAGARGACFRTCAGDAECQDVAATQLCAELDDPRLPPHTTVCVIGCDPVLQRGCIMTDACGISTELDATGAAYANYYECRGGRGTTSQGSACGTMQPDLDTCQPGLACVFSGSDGPSAFECRQYCIDDGDCEGTGLVCLGEPPPDALNEDTAGGGVLHVCIPPP